MSLTLGFVIKIWTLLICAFGICGGIARWFYPSFSVAGFMGGVCIIVLNVLMVSAEVKPIPILDYLRIYTIQLGKGAVFIFLGALWAGSGGFFVAGWIMYWLTGALYIANEYLKFAKLEGPLMGPRAPGEPQADQTMGDNYSQLE